MAEQAKVMYVLAGPSSCPAAAEPAADLAELIVMHSDFQPLMAQSSVEPLPAAATQLAVPLTSLLPFVTVHDDTQQEVSTQLKHIVLQMIHIGRWEEGRLWPTSGSVLTFCADNGQCESVACYRGLICFCRLRCHVHAGCDCQAGNAGAACCPC